MASSHPDNYSIPLSAITSSPYQLIYGILLLVPSIPVTFAGAFLTLDRTRSFAPSNPGTSTKKTKVAFRFEGGVGGVLAGWLFGVHLSTLLALAIMNETSAKQLVSIQFLVIWLLSGLLVSVVAARWRLAAVLLIGLGGGAAFSLFVTVVCHPAKLARVILLAVCSTISAILCLLPIPHIRHVALRSGGAWLGAMGVIVSISVLSRVSDWADAWARLWVDWDSHWGTSQEKGLSAAFAILAALGIATDWLLKRQFGECPDEKWDSYLANYAANLPNSHDRPGNFSPSLPFWKKIFNPPPKEPIVFPPDTALMSSRKQLSPPPYQQGKLRSMSKKSRAWSSNSFQPINKKDPLGFTSDTGSSSDEDEHVDANGRYIPRPWAKRKTTGTTSLSGVTLTDAPTASLSKGKGKDVDNAKGEDIVYSDGESAITATIKRKGDRNAPGWTPEFIKRRSDQASKPLLKDVEIGDVELEKKRNKSTEASPTDSSPPGAVPMTPSLMRALDRVSQAQNEAYGGIISKGHTPRASTAGHQAASSLGDATTPGIPPMQMPTPGGGYNWGVFWKNVEEKAKEADSPSSHQAKPPPNKPSR